MALDDVGGPGRRRWPRRRRWPSVVSAALMCCSGRRAAVRMRAVTDARVMVPQTVAHPAPTLTTVRPGPREPPPGRHAGFPRGDSCTSPDAASRLGLTALAVAALGAVTTTPDAAEARPRPVERQLLALNDFHGNTEPRAGRAAPSRPARRWRRIPRHPPCRTGQGRPQENTITVAAGDLIGLAAALAAFHDEPTIEALSLAGSTTPASATTIRRGRRRAAPDPERRLPPGRRLRGRHALQGCRLRLPVGERVQDPDR